MFFSVIAMVVQALFCKLLFSPTANTDMTLPQALGLFVNIIILIFSINFSINEKKSSAIRNMIIVSLFLRLVILFWDIYARDIFVLPNSEADAVWYKSASASYAFFGRSDQRDFTEYSFYVGLLYRIIGIQEITAQYLNVYFAIFSIVLIYKMLCMFEVNDKTKKTAIALICFLPNSLLIMTFFLQESVIAFCIVISLYLYTKWWFGGNYLYFFLSMIPSILSAFLHVGSIVFVVAIIAAFPFVGNTKRRFRMSAVATLFSVLIAVVVFAYISSNSSVFFAKTGGTLTAESIIEHSGPDDTITDADYFIGITGLSSFSSIIINSPIRMLYFISSPLPWMWRSPSDVLAFVGSSLFYIFVFFYVLKAIRINKSLSNGSLKSYAFVLVIMIFLATIMFGWGVSNTGTALRHREKFTYIFTIAFAISQEIILRARSKDGIQKNIGNNTGL